MRLATYTEALETSPRGVAGRRTTLWESDRAGVTPVAESDTRWVLPCGSVRQGRDSRASPARGGAYETVRVTVSCGSSTPKAPPSPPSTLAPGGSPTKPKRCGSAEALVIRSGAAARSPTATRPRLRRGGSKRTSALVSAARRTTSQGRAWPLTAMRTGASTTGASAAPSTSSPCLRAASSISGLGLSFTLKTNFSLGWQKAILGRNSTKPASAGCGITRHLRAQLEALRTATSERYSRPCTHVLKSTRPASTVTATGAPEPESATSIGGGGEARPPTRAPSKLTRRLASSGASVSGAYVTTTAHSPYAPTTPDSVKLSAAAPSAPCVPPSVPPPTISTVKGASRTPALQSRTVRLRTSPRVTPPKSRLFVEALTSHLRLVHTSGTSTRPVSESKGSTVSMSSSSLGSNATVSSQPMPGATLPGKVYVTAKKSLKAASISSSLKALYPRLALVSVTLWRYTLPTSKSRKRMMSGVAMNAGA